jgi:hypothetical protein
VWQGHRTGRARWYALAIASAFAVFQLHLLGAAFVIPILALIVFDLGQAIRRDRSRVRGILVGIAIGAAITAVLFIPLLVNELQTSFEETRRTLDFLQHGGSVPTVGGLDPTSALIFIVFRFIGWPLVGQVIEVPIAASIAVAVFLALAIWWLVVARGEERLLIGWLVGTMAFAVVALSITAPWLRFVVIGFPTDHYHAFLNPVVMIVLPLAGLGFIRGRRDRGRRDLGARDRPAAASSADEHGRRRSRVVAAAFLSLLLVAELVAAAARQPPPSEVGTWPGAVAIAEQVLELTGDQPIALLPVPDFKSPDSIGYPLVYLGGNVIGDTGQDPDVSEPVDVRQAEMLVVNCDERFRQVNFYACGGDVEDRQVTTLLRGTGRSAQLLARFVESSAMTVSVYELSGS